MSDTGKPALYRYAASTPGQDSDESRRGHHGHPKGKEAKSWS
jgi:hypothetical protein